MRDSLFPVGEYRRVRTDLYDWRTLDPEMEFGYMLEVDITYPDGCHAALDSFPPLPERVTPPGCTGTRLLNDLRPKLHYVLNLGYLQLVLRLGGVLERIHNVLEFKQERFLKPYIEKLCLLRQQSTTKYANTLYKYLANIIAGEYAPNLYFDFIIDLIKKNAYFILLSKAFALRFLKQVLGFMHTQ